MTKIRVLLVDDENVVRDGFATILRLQPDMLVVGEAHDGLEALELARTAKPHVVLLDLHMPRLDGLATIPRLKEMLPDSKILVLTSYAETDKVYGALRSGALGYLLKDATREQMLQAIHDVANGQASIAPGMALKVIHEIDHPVEERLTADPLTPREHETLLLIARGLSNHEIAKALVVHDRTVAKYVSNVLAKLQLASRTQAALYAVKKGLTGPPEEETEEDDERKL
jgi:DNA-binding NarL/FixJ family response regulator